MKRILREMKPRFRWPGTYTRCSCEAALFDPSYPLCDACVIGDVRRDLGKPLWDMDHFRAALAARYVDRIDHWQQRRWAFNCPNIPQDGTVLAAMFAGPKRRRVKLKLVKG